MQDLPATEEAAALDQGRFHSLIADIYDAALEPERWPKTLGAIGDAVGAAATTIAILDGIGNCKDLLQSGIPRDYKERFLAEFSALNSNPGATVVPMLQVGVPEYVAHRVGMDRYLASPFYQEMCRPIGLLNPIAVIVAKGPTNNIGFSAVSPDKKQEFDPDEYARLVAIIPHLQRALNVFVRLGTLSELNLALAEALDRVTSAGVVLVDAAGAVILANRPAEEIARERDGFALGPIGISAATSDLTRHLHRLIAAAAQNSIGDGLHSGGAIRLARPSGRRPLLAVVSPVGRTEWPLLARRPAAMVLICDPEKEVTVPPMRLSQLFGFTQREAQIAALLAQGADLTEAAERLGLSRATAHTHLKRIMVKTDTHRQAELVSVLLRSLSGVSEPKGAVMLPE